MMIRKGVPSLLQGCQGAGTAQLASKKEHLFQKIFFFEKIYFLKYTLYRPLSMQISTFSKICREVLFIYVEQE